MYHSNRHIPETYWHRNWSPPNGKKKTAGVIVIRNDNILLVQSYGDKYGFPKGSLDANESYLHAAERELFEETGMRIDLSNKRKIMDESKNKIVVFFVVDDGPEIVPENLPKHTHEITSIGYVPMKYMNNMSLNSMTRYIFRNIYQS
jgi:8-oxo-dGTP pyrophosphatase MutT (NUDIX family)